MVKNSIVLVPFPFDDFSSTKVRPALCLTSAMGSYGHVVIAFISSTIPDDLMLSDIFLKKSEQKSVGTGLILDSVIRLHKLVTIPSTLIKRQLGRTNVLLDMEVKEKLLNMFEL